MTYEYVCTSCHHEWEAEQRISEPALDTCPSCGKRSARRQVSGGAGFILKGGGWYADGYSSGGASARKGSEGTTTSTVSTGASTADSGSSAASGGASSPAAKTGSESGKAGAAGATSATSAKPAAA